MKTFKLNYKPLVALAVMIVLSLGLALSVPKEKQVVQAVSESCEIGDIIVNTPVLCWATDAVNFVLSNQLFSVLNQHDLRDAVKHYRFYQLVISELNK